MDNISKQFSRQTIDASDGSMQPPSRPRQNLAAAVPSAGTETGRGGAQNQSTGFSAQSSDTSQRQSAQRRSRRSQYSGALPDSSQVQSSSSQAHVPQAHVSDSSTSSRNKAVPTLSANWQRGYSVSDIYRDGSSRDYTTEFSKRGLPSPISISFVENKGSPFKDDSCKLVVSLTATSVDVQSFESTMKNRGYKLSKWASPNTEVSISDMSKANDFMADVQTFVRIPSVVLDNLSAKMGVNIEKVDSKVQSLQYYAMKSLVSSFTQGKISGISDGTIPLYIDTSEQIATAYRNYQETGEID